VRVVWLLCVCFNGLDMSHICEKAPPHLLCVEAYICSCVYIYQYIYINIYVNIYINMYQYISIYVNIRGGTYLYIYIDIYVYKLLCMACGICTTRNARCMSKYVLSTIFVCLILSQMHVILYMCMYIYIYTYTYTYIYVYIYIHICTYAYTYIYIYIYLRTERERPSHMAARDDYMCAYTSYTHTYIHTYTYTYI